MRILHVIQGLDAGGAERIVVSLVAGARDAGHDVAVAAPSGSLEAQLGCRRFELPIVRRDPRRLPSAVFRIRGITRRWRPTIIHSHNPTMAAATALVTIRGLHPKALVSVHGMPESDYGRTARILRLAGLPVIPCGPGVDAALREHGVRSRATIPNGIAPAPPPMERSDVLRSVDAPEGSSLIVSVGRLVPQKNHALAVRATAKVPGATLVVVGSGPMASDLLQLARELGVEDRVKMTGERQDARAILGAADLVVMSSRWEGMPLVALEALAAGIPLVATDVRGIRELLQDQVNSILVPDGDAAGLAVAILRALTDLDLRSRLSSEGPSLAAHFTEARMVSRFLDLYEQLVA